MTLKRSVKELTGGSRTERDFAPRFKSQSFGRRCRAAEEKLREYLLLDGDVIPTEIGDHLGDALLLWAGF
jgi:hypothetical protein